MRKTVARAVACGGAALLFAAACGKPAVEERVLFIGNSYVFTNDLPATFQQLAEAGHHHVLVGMAATGGWTLQQHVESPETKATLSKAAWTRIVLQEQSVLPAFRTERVRRMYPAVRTFVHDARSRHARPMLLSTWARRDGLAEAGFPSFEAMEAELDEGYRAIAEETGAAIIPAGAAWAAAHAQIPTLELWGPDGSHPSATGTYLTACVVYATVFRATPLGLPPLLGVSAEVARRLQTIAARIALAPPAP